MINILISLTKAAISTDTNNWLASWGGRRGKASQSFETLIFPSQQLPPMTVIYMANRQYYVYKIILGKKALNSLLPAQPRRCYLLRCWVSFLPFYLLHPSRQASPRRPCECAQSTEHPSSSWDGLSSNSRKGKPQASRK